MCTGVGFFFSPKKKKVIVLQPTNSVVFIFVCAQIAGVMAGFNMSGDLRKPATNIPLGSLSAIGIS